MDCIAWHKPIVTMWQVYYYNSQIWNARDRTPVLKVASVFERIGYYWWYIVNQEENMILTRPAVNIVINKNDISRVTIVWSMWRHQQSIVTSSAERKPSKWDTVTIFEECRF